MPCLAPKGYARRQFRLGAQSAQRLPRGVKARCVAHEVNQVSGGDDSTAAPEPRSNREQRSDGQTRFLKDVLRSPSATEPAAIMADLGAILATRKGGVSSRAKEAAARIQQMMQVAMSDDRIPTFLYRLGQVRQAHPAIREHLHASPTYMAMLKELMSLACKQDSTYTDPRSAAQMAQCQVKLRLLCNEYWRGWEERDMAMLSGPEFSSVVLAAGKLATDFGRFNLRLPKHMRDNIIRTVQVTDLPAQLGPRALANVAIGCARLGIKDSEVWQRLNVAVLRLSAILHAPAVASILWSWGKVSAQVEAEVFGKLMLQLESTAGSMNLQGLGMCMMGMSGCRRRPPEQTWLQVQRALLAALQPQEKEGRYSQVIQVTRQTLLSLARLALVDEELILALLASISSSSANVTAQSCANVAWSCACLSAVMNRASDQQHSSLGARLNEVVLQQFHALAEKPRAELNTMDITQIVQSAPLVNMEGTTGLTPSVHDLLVWCGEESSPNLEKEAAGLAPKLRGLRTALEQLSTTSTVPVAVTCPAVVGPTIPDALLEAADTRIALLLVRTAPFLGQVVRAPDGGLDVYQGALQLQIENLKAIGCSVVCVEVADARKPEDFTDVLQAKLREAGLPIK